MTSIISICIPAYKRTDYLRRLLDSIAIQEYKDFEVIVTDDSPGNEVSELCNSYKGKFPLNYFRNEKPLGTPENWNAAIRQAKGQWIKLMHDDDWFSSASSLQQFVNLVDKFPRESFYFSAYNNVYENSGKTEAVFMNSFRKRELIEDPVTLFSSNVIGPPSVILVKNDPKIEYDKRMKWLVDIDYYVRYLGTTKPVYLENTLINVGINKDQVTKTAFRVPEVEIPENFLFLEKTGVHHLKKLLVYDAWWRSVRNLGIRDLQFIQDKGYSGEVPAIIRSMIAWQRKIPKALIRSGVFSKMFMFIHFLTHRIK